MTLMGSLHPILFFAGVYVVALLFSMFICSALFYSCMEKGMVEAASHNTVKQTEGSVANK
jgi:hypothetical protein